MEQEMGPSAPSSPWKHSLVLSVFGQGISDRLEQTRSAGVGGVASITYEPQTWLTADLRLLALAQSGSAHGLTNPSVPRNFFYPLNATMELKPNKYVAVEGGAMGQTQFNNPLLMDVYSFPGVAQKLYAFNDREFKLYFQANQSVPVSTSMTNTSSQNEALPTMFSNTLQVRYTPDKLTNVRFSGGHWAFNDLPSQTAMESMRSGNTVFGTQMPNFRYAYGFQGITASASAEAPLTPRIIPKIGGTYLRNVEAPDGRNQAYSTLGFLKVRATREVSLTGGGEWFISESDASPAVYNLAAFDFNSTGFGHSNRQGYAAEFRVTYEPNNFTVKARYTDARLLEKNAQQADTQIFFVGLEIAEVTLF